MTEEMAFIGLNFKELTYIQNDLIAYMYEIKEKVLGKERTNQLMVEDPGSVTKSELEDLEMLGFFERAKLLDKITKAKIKKYQPLNEKSE